MSETLVEGEHPPMPSLSLSGKRLIVAGGKTGMGLGIARAAHAAGVAVTVASRRISPADERPGLATFEQISLDIRSEAAVREAFATIGNLDHLAVTAAPDMGSWGAFMAADTRGVRSCLEGKFLGSWACARYAVFHVASGGPSPSSPEAPRYAPPPSLPPSPPLRPYRGRWHLSWRRSGQHDPARLRRH